MRQLLNRGGLVFGGHGIVALLSFARNIVIARAVSVEDFGIAATFALTLSFLEMATGFAIEKVLVQDPAGGSDEMLSSVHFLQAFKGVVIGAVLFACASPAALLFGLHDMVWAYQLVALVPVIKGFSNLDAVVYQRELRFGRSVTVEIAPQLISLLIAFPLTSVLADYRAVLILVILQPVCSVIVSHLVANRRYKLSFNCYLIKKKLTFGWPLLVNGLLLFAVFQGDKALIGAFYSMETLGMYSVAFAVAMLPSGLVAKALSSLFLPTLSSSRDNFDRFNDLSTALLAASFISAVVLAQAIVIFGEALISVAYGVAYFIGSETLWWLTLMHAMRILRMCPTVISTSCGHTKHAMYANGCRVLSLCVATALAVEGAPVEYIAMVGFIGELASFLAAICFLRAPLSLRRFVSQCMKTGAVAAAIMLAASRLNPPAVDGYGLPYLLLVQLTVFFSLSMVIAVCALMFDGNMRRLAYQLTKRRVLS